MSLTYRTPAVSDAAPLAALCRDTFIETFGDLYRAEDLTAFLDQAYSVETIRAELTDEKLYWLVAETDGELIGYCKLLHGLSLDYDVYDRTVAQLNQLYVRSPHQGKGVAQMLMDWAMQTAERLSAEDIILSVYCDNLRAQRFYQKYGFTHVGDTIFMVGAHEDHEFIYRKAMNILH